MIAAMILTFGFVGIIMLSKWIVWHSDMLIAKEAQERERLKAKEDKAKKQEEKNKKKETQQ